jgi:drug/metabolite transporter (DMT)-like permease
VSRLEHAALIQSADGGTGLKPAIIALLAVSIALGACGQLLFKFGAQKLPSLAEVGLGGALLRMLGTPTVFIGFVCFFLSSLLWIYALRQVPLSVAYPFVSISYIVIFIGSAVFFSEAISWRHWSGAALIVAGIVLINLKS